MIGKRSSRQAEMNSDAVANGLSSISSRDCSSLLLRWNRFEYRLWMERTLASKCDLNRVICTGESLDGGTASTVSLVFVLGALADCASTKNPPSVGKGLCEMGPPVVFGMQRSNASNQERCCIRLMNIVPARCGSAACFCLCDSQADVLHSAAPRTLLASGRFLFSVHFRLHTA